MEALHQLPLVSCLLFSVATVTTAVPFDRQVGLNSNVYTQNNDSSSSDNVCMIDDVLYQEGDAIPTASPCEKCVCRPPGFACSIITCEKRPNCRALQRSNQCCPEYKCDCEHEGKVYHNGEKLDNTLNPCKVCYCQGGEVACTVIECYKRDDCIPKHVPGMCCPKYDNCPPRDPARSASSSFSPPVQSPNATAAKEAQQSREVADDRLNLLGEPGVTGQLLPEKSISNNIDDLPQGDDPLVYEAYDNNYSSTSSTTGFIVYDDGNSAMTTANYEDNSSPSTAEGSSQTTIFPTFPTDWLTGFEWGQSTAGSTDGGSTEYIPTWGSMTQSTSTLTAQNASISTDQSSSSSVDSTSTPSETMPTESTSTETTYFTDSSSVSSTQTSTSVHTESKSASETGETDPYTDTTWSSSSQTTFSDATDSTSASTFSTLATTLYGPSISPEDASSNATLYMADSTAGFSTDDMTSIPGSGGGEPDTSVPRCYDYGENCEGSSEHIDGTTVITNDETDREVNNADLTPAEYHSVSVTESETFSELTEQDVTKMSSENTDFTSTEKSSEADTTGFMLTNMVQADQGNNDAETSILPDMLVFKSNKTVETLEIDSNDTAEASGDVAMPQERLKKTGEAEESSTSSSDDQSTITTDNLIPTSTEGDVYETNPSVSSSSSSTPSDGETTVTEGTTSSITTGTYTTGSSSTSETLSTTQTSETSSQSTEAWVDSTTTESNS